MGRWTDLAEWRGPIPNCGPGVMSAHRGVVIHTAQGSFDGTLAWQRNPDAQVGSHFLTAKDGRCVQLIDTGTRSWCQSAGNDTWLSIENEGWGSRGEALSSGQVEACARILAKAHQVYGVPLQVSNSPNTPGLGWHGMGGAAWGGHTGCPGNAIKAQLSAIVARAAQIVGGVDLLQQDERDALFQVRQMLDDFYTGNNKPANIATSLQRSAMAKVDTLAAKSGQPAPVAMTDADKQAVAGMVLAGIKADLAPLIDLARKINNG